MPEEVGGGGEDGALAVAVKVSGLLVRPAADAVTVSLPAADPRTNVAEAVPEPLVVTCKLDGVPLPPTRVPPPEVTAKVTATPLTGFPLESVTFTKKELDNCVETEPDWLLPLTIVSVVGVPDEGGVAVAVKVSGLLVRPAAEAVTVSLPATDPRTNVAEAVPEPLVVTCKVDGVPLPPTRIPPPDVTAKVTATPLTGFPLESVTCAAKGLDNCVETEADWLLPLTIVSMVGVPAGGGGLLPDAIAPIEGVPPKELPYAS